MVDGIIEDLAIVTPSRIDGRERLNYATDSVRSLRQAVGNELLHVVVHDVPWYVTRLPSDIAAKLPYARWHCKSSEVYSQERTRVRIRQGRGSASATLEATGMAREEGIKYCFIHLDDHVYLPAFGRMLRYGYEALEADQDLMWVRYSGYPLIYANRVPLEQNGDEVRFDDISLRSRRESDYTLWWDDLKTSTVRGRYWPIAMWFCIFRLEFLERLLGEAPIGAGRHLASVELFYKQESNWSDLIAGKNGRFGYINMQFGGIEMHRNKNWRQLMQLENCEMR